MKTHCYSSLADLWDGVEREKRASRTFGQSSALIEDLGPCDRCTHKARCANDSLICDQYVAYLDQVTVRVRSRFRPYSDADQEPRQRTEREAGL